MHPAPSIIAFTTLSGLGFGLLAWTGLLEAAGALPLDLLFGVATIVFALGCATSGLLASMLHLGRPERAWRAFSQWRSSWLSREGVAALATYVPALLFAGLWLSGATGIAWAVCGLLAAVGSIATVISTAMIYRSLKPIRQWHNHWVVPNYLLLAAMTGAFWLTAALGVFDVIRPVVAALTAALVLVAAGGKILYWRFIDRTSAASSLSSATGLPSGRVIRPLDPPHTQENYLLREMGYRIARRNAGMLRGVAVAAGFAAPLILLGFAWTFRNGSASALLATAAALLSTAGVLVERWLFFAEATHTVMLYYRGAPDQTEPRHQ